MRHYVNVEILPNTEIGYGALLSAVFERLHLAFVEHGEGRVGVSFPKHDEKACTLGSWIRLHGSEDRLLRVLQRLGNGFRDYIRVVGPKEVPPNTPFRIVRRVQAKSGIPRLARRYAKRHSIDEAEALALYKDVNAEQLKLPFVELRSGSTGRHFRLFIKHEAVQVTPHTGAFSSYGLSTDAAVPWF